SNINKPASQNEGFVVFNNKDAVSHSSPASSLNQAEIKNLNFKDYSNLNLNEANNVDKNKITNAITEENITLSEKNNKNLSKIDLSSNKISLNSFPESNVSSGVLNPFQKQSLKTNSKINRSSSLLQNKIDSMNGEFLTNDSDSKNPIDLVTNKNNLPKQFTSHEYLDLKNELTEQNLKNKNMSLTKSSESSIQQKTNEFLKDNFVNQKNNLDYSSQNIVPLNQVFSHRNSLQTMKPVEVTGHVTLGSGAKSQFTRESVINVSNQLKQLASQGGGKMKIKLNPVELGELNLKVETKGSQVALSIQAADQSATKALRESISNLEEQLKKHDLNLGSVELTTFSDKSQSVPFAIGSHLGDQFNSNLDQGNYSQQEHVSDGFFYNDQSSSRGQSERFDSLGSNKSIQASPLRVESESKSHSNVVNGRLDVRV
ncbi:MAG: hypothetical protein CL678_18290, partial [Bdellovibrionaceae bacterium]|nr:hypothetical protein [Pseudobdellovibrionaceae bacterium]